MPMPSSKPFNLASTPTGGGHEPVTHHGPPKGGGEVKLKYSVQYRGWELQPLVYLCGGMREVIGPSGMDATGTRGHLGRLGYAEHMRVKFMVSPPMSIIAAAV